MRLTLKTLVLSSAALCATAAFAANQARVDVPFSFTVKGQSFPAGSYQVVSEPSRDFVTLASNTDTKKSITWGVGPAEMTKAPAVLKFDVIGEDYALRTIQIGARITPNLDKKSKHGVSATTSISGQ